MVLGFFIKRHAKNEKFKKLYIDFINNMEHAGLASVSLHEDDRAQVDELKARRDKLNQEQ